LLQVNILKKSIWRLTIFAIFCKKCKKMYNNNAKTKETEIKKRVDKDDNTAMST
jgi:ribosomal protein L37AE/L43A